MMSMIMGISSIILGMMIIEGWIGKLKMRMYYRDIDVGLL